MCVLKITHKHTYSHSLLWHLTQFWKSGSWSCYPFWPHHSLIMDLPFIHHVSLSFFAPVRLPRVLSLHGVTPDHLCQMQQWRISAGLDRQGALSPAEVLWSKSVHRERSLLFTPTYFVRKLFATILHDLNILYDLQLKVSWNGLKTQ